MCACCRPRSISSGTAISVFIAADAVASRRDFDRDTALALLRQAGITIGTTEMFAFQMLERAGTDQFKAISKIVR